MRGSQPEAKVEAKEEEARGVHVQAQPLYVGVQAAVAPGDGSHGGGGGRVLSADALVFFGTAGMNLLMGGSGESRDSSSDGSSGGGGKVINCFLK
jgi:hypothetical protein